MDTLLDLEIQNYPIIYEVTRVRDGRSFSTRSVNAKQEDKIIFSCLLSFQNPENGLNYQIKMPDCKQPEDCENDNERWEKISRIINPSDSEKSSFTEQKSELSICALLIR